MLEVTLRAKFARRIPDPILKGAERHILLCRVEDVPKSLPMDPNPRAQRIDRGIWREIRGHLLNREGIANTFHLKNKGITALAVSVSKDDDENYTLAFTDGQGIVDGGHTYSLILDAQDELNEINAATEAERRVHQFVKIEVLTGIDAPIASEIAGGLNTAIQVQPMSLLNLQGRFDWIKEELKEEPYFSNIAFKENLATDFDARDLVVLLDLFNTKRFPNSGSEHPWRAYMSKAAVLEDYDANPGPFTRLSPILRDILVLHDLASAECIKRHNEGGGKAGKLSFIESKERGKYRFPFTGHQAKMRLSRAALFPVLAAFRWMVEDTPEGVRWRGSFDTVRTVLERSAAELMKATQNTNEDVGRRANAIGRSKNHWANLHNIVAKHEMLTTR